jgi:hypothetical protein
MNLEQVQSLVDGLGQSQLLYQQVHGSDAAIDDAAATVADLVLDVGSGEHRLGTPLQVVFLQAPLKPALAASQLLSYLGVHSKSLRDRGDEFCDYSSNPGNAEGFRVFHEIDYAGNGEFA